MGTLSSAQSGLEGCISFADEIVNDDAGAYEGHSPGGYQRQESADESSDEDEDGFPKQRLGSGVWGTGPPMVSELMGKRRAFVDGAGLCSPGRWPPEQRKDESLDGRLGMAKQCFEQLQQLLRDKMDVVSFLDLPAADTMTRPLMITCWMMLGSSSKGKFTAMALSLTWTMFLTGSLFD